MRDGLDVSSSPRMVITNRNWIISGIFAYFLCSFCSHVRWSKRRFLLRTQVSSVLMNDAKSSSVDDVKSTSSCLGTWSIFLASILALFVRIDVVKFTLGVSSLTCIALGLERPLEKAMTTFFGEFIIRHAKIRIYLFLLCPLISRWWRFSNFIVRYNIVVPASFLHTVHRIAVRRKLTTLDITRCQEHPKPTDWRNKLTRCDSISCIVDHARLGMSGARGARWLAELPGAASLSLAELSRSTAGLTSPRTADSQTLARASFMFLKRDINSRNLREINKTLL